MFFSHILTLLEQTNFHPAYQKVARFFILKCPYKVSSEFYSRYKELRNQYLIETEQLFGQQERPEILFSLLLDSLETNDCDPLFQKLTLSIIDRYNGQIPKHLVSRYHEIRDLACANLEKKWPNADLYRSQSPIHS